MRTHNEGVWGGNTVEPVIEGFELLVYATVEIEIQVQVNVI